MLKEGKTVRYKDLINNARAKEYYNASHIIITLTDEEIDDILDKCFVEI